MDITTTTINKIIKRTTKSCVFLVCGQPQSSRRILRRTFPYRTVLALKSSKRALAFQIFEISEFHEKPTSLLQESRQNNDAID
ncbi:hypothetical protein Glove_4g1 [Diversispora epigaea]|uniref:Uncharacterized protein n=1 Tax=Diversispora epigaea TaxID=1348612 RepID=A0A397JZE0_9GLOM|nr:hypothetical protein Glove_4g1 [Diversispora epigaea]